VILPEIDVNLIGVDDDHIARQYICYLEAAFREEHAMWLEQTYKKHGRSPRFAAKCVRRFWRWLIAMRAYVARQQHFHYRIDHLSVTLHLRGQSKPLARIEVSQRTGIAFPEEE